MPSQEFWDKWFSMSNEEREAEKRRARNEGHPGQYNEQVHGHSPYSKPSNAVLSYRGRVWIAALLFCGAFWFGAFWIMRAALS